MRPSELATLESELATLESELATQASVNHSTQMAHQSELTDSPDRLRLSGQSPPSNFLHEVVGLLLVGPKVLPRFVLSFPFGLHGELKDVIQSKVLLQ